MKFLHSEDSVSSEPESETGGRNAFRATFMKYRNTPS